MPDSTPFAELRIPHHGIAAATTIGYLAVCMASVAAACNLLFVEYVPAISGITSVLWLLLMSWWVVDGVRDDGGMKQYFINRMGRYSKLQCVRATPEHHARTISFGYVMFDRFFTYLALDVSAISSVDWSSGQATALAGRDMDDWQVAVWFHPPDGARTKRFPGVREEEIFIVGPSGPRASVEAFGQQLVEFLKAAGVRLSPGQDDREFINSSRRVAVDPRGKRELK